MRLLLIIKFLILLLWGCSSRVDDADFSYIKVLTDTPADSVTRYNKGFTTGTFLYYEPKKDSLVFYFPTGDRPTDDKAYTGRLQNEAYMDTLNNLISVLRRYGNGPLPVSSAGGNSTYHGPVYYVEYKDGKGVHNNAFILLTDSDTLHQFDDFYGRLIHLPWQRKEVASRIISRDSELVNLGSKIGWYQKVVTPYIIPPCNSGVDLTKLYGVWRSSNMSHRDDTYTKLTFQKDSVCIWGRVKNGMSNKVERMRFIQKGQSLTLLQEGKEITYQILSLSERCLEYQSKDEGAVFRYGRM